MEYKYNTDINNHVCRYQYPVKCDEAHNPICFISLTSDLGLCSALSNMKILGMVFDNLETEERTDKLYEVVTFSIV